MSKFEHVSSDGHQMSLDPMSSGEACTMSSHVWGAVGLGPGGACTVRSNAQPRNVFDCKLIVYHLLEQQLFSLFVLLELSVNNQFMYLKMMLLRPVGKKTAF